MKDRVNNEESGDSPLTSQTPSQDHGSDDIPAQVAVADAVEELMDVLDTEQHCDVDVSVDGKWCTFEGTVDSQEIRTALFDLVPEQDGKRFIVDRLHVTYETSQTDDKYTN